MNIPRFRRSRADRVGARSTGDCSGPVRVALVDGAFGTALSLDGRDSAAPAEPCWGIGEGDDTTDGYLRVFNNGVTLEVIDGHGGRSILAWDPSEVSWSTMMAG